MPKKNTSGLSGFSIDQLGTFDNSLNWTERFALLEAAKYALADAQSFDWLKADHRFSEEWLAGLREKLNNALPETQVELELATA